LPLGDPAQTSLHFLEELDGAALLHLDLELGVTRRGVGVLEVDPQQRRERTFVPLRVRRHALSDSAAARQLSFARIVLPSLSSEVTRRTFVPSASESGTSDGIAVAPSPDGGSGNRMLFTAFAWQPVTSSSNTPAFRVEARARVPR